MYKTVLFSKNGDTLKFDTFSTMEKGRRSDVYTKLDGGNTALRVYHESVPEVRTINEKHFYAIKEIEHEALPKLGEIYYRNPNNTPFDQVVAYTCENVERDDTNLLSVDKEFFVDKVFGRIFGAGMALAEHGYSLSLPQSGDIIINKEGAFLLDPNKFIKEPNLSKEELIKINLYVSLRYIKLAILECLKNRELDEENEASKIISMISSSSDAEETYDKVLKMSA